MCPVPILDKKFGSFCVDPLPKVPLVFGCGGYVYDVE